MACIKGALWFVSLQPKITDYHDVRQAPIAVIFQFQFFSLTSKISPNRRQQNIATQLHWEPHIISMTKWSRCVRFNTGFGIQRNRLFWHHRSPLAPRKIFAKKKKEFRARHLTPQWIQTIILQSSIILILPQPNKTYLNGWTQAQTRRIITVFNHKY